MSKMRGNKTDTARWAVILAGGDGKRLLPLTSALSGDARPKQFCAVLGTQTLLQQTTRRIAPVISPARTKVVLTKHHQQFFDAPSAESGFIVQPTNRGTAPAILYSLLAINAEDATAQVALFPSDHYYADERAFTRSVEVAFRAAALRRDLVILLGVVPTGAETDYGWIQPGARLLDIPASNLFAVRRFEEKPRYEDARRLLASGGLWNSFVLIGTVETLIHLFANSLPDLYDSFEDLERSLGTSLEARTAAKTYHDIPSVDFSHSVLAPNPDSLSVLSMEDCGWTDMGTVPRVLEMRANALTRRVPQPESVGVPG